MSSALRRTPAMVDALRCLVAAGHPVWGLQVSATTGRPTGTVYPLLDRLEQAGYVESSWEGANDRPGPRRRLYALTASGHAWAQEQSAAAAPAPAWRASARVALS
jgi:PadR family transcriptional regulator PadR